MVDLNSLFNLIEMYPWYALPMVALAGFATGLIAYHSYEMFIAWLNRKYK